MLIRGVVKYSGNSMSGNAAKVAKIATDKTIDRAIKKKQKTVTAMLGSLNL
jgi:hypothetical protein